MAGFDLFALREVFADQGVMICFNGPFSHSVIEELGIAVRKYLESADAPTSRVADVFAVFVEQAQNLKNYASRETLGREEAGSHRSGTLVIAREGERYVVSSGNMVRAEDIGRVVDRLKALDGLDKAALKVAYKERLRGSAEGESSAGLGFIDMARRAAEPLRFSVRELSGDLVFFSISVLI